MANYLGNTCRHGPQTALPLYVKLRCLILPLPVAFEKVVRIEFIYFA